MVHLWTKVLIQHFFSFPVLLPQFYILALLWKEHELYENVDYNNIISALIERQKINFMG